MATYADFQQQSESNKVGLARVDAAKRLLGWTLDSGSVYQIGFTDSPVVVKVVDSAAELTSVASKAAITPGSYFFERSTDTLFLETSGSTNPNLSFIGITFRLFFATEPVIAAYDLSSGFEVPWRPLLKPLSKYGVRLNTADQTGQALEGSGRIDFFNEQDFWRSRYDKYFFENKLCEIYSWSNELAITEAKLLYRGRVVSKSYSPAAVSLGLKDIINQLRASPSLGRMQDVSGARIPDGLKEAFQRRIYGYKFGYRPTNISQTLDSFPLSGTVSISNGSTTLTGVGTSFLNDLSPDDDIFLNGLEDPVTVESIQSDTSLTVSQDFEGAGVSGLSYSVEPELSKRYINRTHFVSGDTLAEPSTTVTSAENTLIFNVASTDGFRAGDPIIIGGEERTLLRISGNTFRVTVAFSSTPSGTVTRPSFSNVRINNTLLTRTTDYTVPASNDRIILDDLAEFNVAKIRTLSPGTVSMTSGLRSVTGTSTNFLLLSPGDWIRVKGASTNTFFEVLQVNSETSLDLRVASDTTASGTADLKQPNVYTEGTDVLTCDVIGKTDDGTKTGSLLTKAPEIVKDLLTEVGIEATDIDAWSFITANDLTEARLGLAIPDKFNDKKVPKTRDLINRCNESVFGALVQDEDFLLAYRVLSPGRTLEDTTIDETEVLKFSVVSKSDRILKTAFINYNAKEYDPLTGDESFETASSTSNIASFLAETENTATKDTLLIDDNDATIVAQRLKFIREISSSTVRFTTKMQTSRLQVTDIIKFSHPKLYERFGSTENEKMAAIQSLKKSASEVDIELDDLGNAFNRSYTITENTANNFTNSTAEEKVVNGFITDNSGLIDNDPDTEGLYLIY